MKLEKYRVKPGGFRLRDHDAGDTGEFHSKEAAKKHVRAAVEKALSGEPTPKGPDFKTLMLR